VVSNPLITILSVDSGRDLTINEGIGFRATLPLPEAGGIRSVVSAGLDYKNFHLTSYNTNNFLTQSLITNSMGQVTIRQDNTPSAQPTRFSSVTYLPVSARWEGSRADNGGYWSGFAGIAYNLPALSDAEDFKIVAQNSKARMGYTTIQAGLTREQKIYGEYKLLIRADGQWARGPLISNEQFGVGGSAGVRGYLEGEQYGDTGWRVGLEPRTPFFELGYLDGTLPFRVRGLVFVDYGELHHLDLATSQTARLWGTGVGLQAKAGERWDVRFTMGWALLGGAFSAVGTYRAQFAIGLQF
jgi:hemolysin activation/secretion protein